MQDETGEAERHFVPRPDGTRIAYADYRPAGVGRAQVLMVHGLASSGEQFAREARRLAGAGYRVLVPDLRGHGNSGVPDGPIRPKDFALSVLVEDLTAVMDHAGAEAVHWVGNSLGGIVALDLLGAEHVGRLRSLAVFGTCFSMNLPPQAGLALRAAFVPGKAVTARLTAMSTTRDAEGRRVVERAIRQFHPGAGAALADAVRRYDYLDNVWRFERPLLVLWGGKDRMVNLRLRGDLVQLDGHKTLRRVDLPRGGHCANLDVHDQFCAALLEHLEGAGE